MTRLVFQIVGILWLAVLFLILMAIGAIAMSLVLAVFLKT